MSPKRKITRKRNRIISRIIKIYSILITVGILGILVIFFYLFLNPRPNYISPVSGVMHFDYTLQNDSVLFENLLREKKVAYESIKMTNTSYIIKLKKGPEVYFSKSKNLEKQISSLQYILTRLTMEGKQFRKLDLQFDKPVITF